MTPSQFRSGGRGSTDALRGWRMFAGLHPGRSLRQRHCRHSVRRRPERSCFAICRSGFRRRGLSEAIRSSSGSLRPWSERSSARADVELPLDVRGTAFQQRVWQALREIPRGSTASYAEIAARIGQPKAVRAVARACASNEIAVAIPCHRVVRDGRVAQRLPVGRRAQAGAVGAGGQIMSSPAQLRRAAHRVPAQPISLNAWRRLDWPAIETGLETCGWAGTGPLLSAHECEGLAALYPSDGNFRSRIIMARHGFGSGEYKYLAIPLPGIIGSLRASLYPPLAQIASRWNEAIGIPARYPPEHADFIGACHRAGQTKPTPLILQYGPGDYNCLHQDIYGDLVFPVPGCVPPVPAWPGFYRRRVRAHGATAPYAIARGGRAAAARRGGDLPGSSPAGAGHTGHLPGQYASRRQPSAFWPPPCARHHLPRRQITSALCSPFGSIPSGGGTAMPQRTE